MIISVELLINIISLGLIYALVVLGVYISSTIIKFDDLSTEGSFATGGALAALAVGLGMPGLFSMLCVMIAGGLIGLMTGLLHTKLGLNNLMSGLVVTTALFSVNLKLAGANMVIDRSKTILHLSVLSNQLYAATLVLLLIVVSVVVLIALLMKTEVGYLLKAVGTNPTMLRILGKRVDGYLIAGLVTANSVIALAGMLLVYYTGFFSITGSIGTLVIALAGLTIGRVVCRKSVAGVIVGALLYQAIIAVTIALQIDPTWNKLITAFLMIVLMSIAKMRTE